MRYLAIILALFGLDEMIKSKIEKEDISGDRPALGNLLLIRKYHNKGAFLNTGESNQKLIMALSVFFTVFISLYFLTTLTMGGRGVLKSGLSLLLGGAYSNTYDRLKRKYVVDYVSFNVPWKGLRRVVFNIGDFGIMIGALLCIAADSK